MSSERGKGLVNVLSAEKRLRVLAALVQGNTVLGISEQTGVHQRTIAKFALKIGQGCQRLHDRIVRDLHCYSVQCDEIWSYVGKKQARILPTDPAEWGEAYTFVGLDTASRLAIAFRVGRRDQETTNAFIKDLRARLLVAAQITSDGFQPYIVPIGEQFGPAIPYAQTIKNYTRGGRRDDDHRYEPPRDPFITKKAIFGSPDLDQASTAYIERQNGTMRHRVGRIRRLSYAFSRKLEHHKAAVALGYTAYNFCHVVRTLRVTPAMQAGLTDHVWDLAELMAAALSEAPGEPLDPKPLRHREPEGPSRELPSGRGFLRIIDGGKTRPGLASAPGAPKLTGPVPIKLAPKKGEQLSLFPGDES